MLEPFKVCYHGTVDKSAVSIRKNGIDLSCSYPGTDFGQGFYVTNNKKQVDDWARAKARDMNERGSRFKAKPVVLHFEMNVEALGRLSGVVFEAPTLEWGQFILENRFQSKHYYDLAYDFAIGPVADGRIRSLMKLYKKNKMTDVEFINAIKPIGQMESYTQLSIHSRTAVECLTLKKLEEVEYVV